MALLNRNLTHKNLQLRTSLLCNPQAHHETIRRLERSQLLYFTLFLFAFIFRFAIHIGEATFAAVLAVKVVGHENTGPTRIPWAFSPQAEDLAILINFVVFQHRQLDLKVEGNIMFTH